MPKIFINYRTGDGEYFAAHVDEHLSRRFGDDAVFRAGKSIEAGQDFRSTLSAASAATRALLVVIGPNWATCDAHAGTSLADPDNWTRKEIRNAIEHGANIIPVLCGRKTPRLTPSDLPPGLERLGDFQALTFDTGNARDDLDKIADVLSRLVPGLPPSSPVPPSTETAGSSNSIGGDVSGIAIQAGTFTQNGGSVGNTVINGATGPIHTGAGAQYIGSITSGGTSNYAAGSNPTGIQQNFDSQNPAGNDR